MGVEIEGFKELEASLIRKAKEIKGLEERALQAGAAVTFSAIKANMYDSGNAKGAKETMEIGDVQPGLDGSKEIRIGWPRSAPAGAYIHFPEYGTLHQPPQGKIENAHRTAMAPATKAMRAVLGRAF